MGNHKKIIGQKSANFPFFGKEKKGGHGKISCFFKRIVVHCMRIISKIMLVEYVGNKNIKTVHLSLARGQ
jgi:hypothetical protein